MDSNQLEQEISQGEAVEREFKSDRKRLRDETIYEEIVAMANSVGGVLFIGVEDDGQITGAQPRHGKNTEPLKLQSAIFNNTVPSINTRIAVVEHADGMVIRIETDPYPEVCATTAGKSLRRQVGPDGKPQSVPFYPRDQRSRRTDLGLLDFSAEVIGDITFDDLDPLEFERLRQTISRLRGDKALLEISNEEIAKALQLVESRKGQLYANVTGVLLLGRTETLQKVMPTNAVNFQVFDSQSNVKVNDTFRFPLLRTIEEIATRFEARNEEQEVLVGMFRVPVPNYSDIGFREAVNNTILHRDYSRLEDIYIQWYPDHILVTSPGAFLPGITTENILVHEPKPRNPRLAEAFKRIGLIEKTGRGVDKIYAGQVRYGRPAPDYSRTDEYGVRVILHGGKGSLQFTAFVYEQEKSDGKPLDLDELLVLNHLFFDRRADSERMGRLIQKGTAQGHAVLERLVERGLVEAKGEKKGRVYHLHATLYAQLGNPSGYVRTRGFESIQQEQMILQYIDAHGKIKRTDAMELCHLSKDQAYRILKRMCSSNVLELVGGASKESHYIRFIKD